MMLITRFRSLFNPSHYQGWGKKQKYFEGWYFKLVNASGNRLMAIIPGIAMDGDGNKHAFIQILDGNKKASKYIKFFPQQFQPEKDRFEVRIGNNVFSEKTIALDIPGVHGNLHFGDNVPWPDRWYSPGIMGPYTFVPFMECYHGIVSMDHSIEGILTLENEKINFDAGRGYIEKDWGHSFPDAYVWIQSNHFSEPGMSIKLSVANIPWIGRSFVGFIGGLWLKDRLIKFTTYNKSKLLKADININDVIIILQNQKYRLEINVKRDEATSLASPLMGLMDGRIDESMSAEITVKLFEKHSGSIVFQDTGKNTALEVAGKIHKLVR